MADAESNLVPSEAADQVEVALEEQPMTASCTSTNTSTKTT